MVCCTVSVSYYFQHSITLILRTWTNQKISRKMFEVIKDIHIIILIFKKLA